MAFAARRAWGESILMAREVLMRWAVCAEITQVWLEGSLAGSRAGVRVLVVVKTWGEE